MAPTTCTPAISLPGPGGGGRTSLRPRTAPRPGRHSWEHPSGLRPEHGVPSPGQGRRQSQGSSVSGAGTPPPPTSPATGQGQCVMSKASGSAEHALEFTEISRSRAERPGLRLSLLTGCGPGHSRGDSCKLPQPQAFLGSGRRAAEARGKTLSWDARPGPSRVWPRICGGTTDKPSPSLGC